jgi:hypothetical protein
MQKCNIFISCLSAFASCGFCVSSTTSECPPHCCMVVFTRRFSQILSTLAASAIEIVSAFPFHVNVVPRVETNVPPLQMVRRRRRRYQEDQGGPRAPCEPICGASLTPPPPPPPQVIFYAKDGNLQMLSKVAQYVIKNESGLWLVVVHFFDDETSPMLQELANNISVLVKYCLPRLPMATPTFVKWH